MFQSKTELSFAMLRVVTIPKKHSFAPIQTNFFFLFHTDNLTNTLIKNQTRSHQPTNFAPFVIITPSIQGFTSYLSYNTIDNVHSQEERRTPRHHLGERCQASSPRRKW